MSQIPDKLFFTIGEASELAQVKPYILRYWESEFNLLSPEKTQTGQRRYRQHDIELILQIKDLLYKEGYTIAGAKRKLRQDVRQKQGKEIKIAPAQIKKELLDMLKLMKE